MTTFLARLGQFEPRKAAQTIWSTGKRKRPDWICAECRARNTLRQRRGYGDDAPKLDGGSYLFPGSPEEGSGSMQQQWTESSGARRKDSNAWGFKTDGIRQETSSTFSNQHLPDTKHANTSRDALSETDQMHLWEQFEIAEQDTDVPADESRGRDASRKLADYELPSIADNSLLDVDYRNALSAALTEGEADLVVRCLYAANQANDLEWLRSIPATTFSEIIRLIEPNKFVAKLASAHIELSAAMVAQMRIAPMWQVASEYTLVILQIVAIRRSAGATLSIDDYSVLLRSARDLGNHRLSSSLFRDLLEEGRVPTTSCYNYFMASVVWNGVHRASSRQKVRVIPFNMLARKQARRKARFANYRVGTRGVRELTLRIFNDMLAHGAIANEESFRIVITAAAREGDVDMVKSLLNKIWNIDVAAIMEGQTDSSIAPKAFPEHSPLRPTTALLFAIAHAFGINNDVPAALRTVDFVARHYNLTITEETWSQLFEWTFVLSVPRSHRDSTNGSMIGQLPDKSLLDLWNTMTGPPYRIQPSIGMYNYLIKNLFLRSMTPKLFEMMEEGCHLYTMHRDTEKGYSRRLKEAIHTGASQKSIQVLRQEWEYADLIRRRDRFWTGRWLRLLLGSFRSWHRSDHHLRLFSCKLPRLLWEWRELAPEVVRYETPTGFVEFAIRTEEEMIISAKVRTVIHEQARDLLLASQRYVGDTWVRGSEVKMPSRLHVIDPGSGLLDSKPT